VAGGGDFRRGETGQWGVVSPEFVPDAGFCGRETLEGSGTAMGGSWGVLAVDRARWMAAAEGTVLPEAAKLAPRLGLTSVLFCRERRPDFVMEPVLPMPGWRGGGRAGELSREESGEAGFEGAAERFSGRDPARTWERIWA
jgi:hypothetical protein